MNKLLKHWDPSPLENMSEVKKVATQAALDRLNYLDSKRVSPYLQFEHLGKEVRPADLALDGLEELAHINGIDKLHLVNAHLSDEHGTIHKYFELGMEEYFEKRNKPCIF